MNMYVRRSESHIKYLVILVVWVCMNCGWRYKFRFKCRNVKIESCLERKSASKIIEKTKQRKKQIYEKKTEIMEAVSSMVLWCEFRKSNSVELVT